jgi:rhodanese-related sulfurtransferase
MEPETQITMNDAEAWLILLLVALTMLLPRLLSRLLLGFKAFLPPSEVKRRQETGGPLLLVDVRTRREFLGELGHIRGAVNIPLNEFRRAIADRNNTLPFHDDIPIILICRTDSRAAYAARLLKKAGFVDISVMSGGMQNWNSEAFPTEH